MSFGIPLIFEYFKSINLWAKSFVFIQRQGVLGKSSSLIKRRIVENIPWKILLSQSSWKPNIPCYL